MDTKEKYALLGFLMFFLVCSLALIVWGTDTHQTVSTDSRLNFACVETNKFRRCENLEVVCYESIPSREFSCVKKEE